MSENRGVADESKRRFIKAGLAAGATMLFGWTARQADIVPAIKETVDEMTSKEFSWEETERFVRALSPVLEKYPGQPAEEAVNNPPTEEMFTDIARASLPYFQSEGITNAPYPVTVKIVNKEKGIDGQACGSSDNKTIELVPSYVDRLASESSLHIALPKLLHEETHQQAACDRLTVTSGEAFAQLVPLVVLAAAILDNNPAIPYAKDALFAHLMDLSLGALYAESGSKEKTEAFKRLGQELRLKNPRLTKWFDDHSDVETDLQMKMGEGKITKNYYHRPMELLLEGMHNGKISSRHFRSEANKDLSLTKLTTVLQQEGVVLP